MVFKYKVIDKDGKTQDGVIDAVNIDVAINSLQRRGFIISHIAPEDEKRAGFGKELHFFNKVSNKDIVILSRQMAILFEAQVSALRVFRLLAAETENHALRAAMTQIADDLQGGNTISKSLEKHPKIFSDFYVNMVKAGEESGRLDEIFLFLADYLDRTYEVTSKARNALIYPSFVIVVFIAVMILMFTLVIPKISAIIVDSGQDIPIYTQIVLGISNFFVNYWWLMLVFFVIGGFAFLRYIKTDQGSISWARFKISVPYVGNLYRKLYLSRISDNMHTMLISGIPMMRTLEITSAVVDNKIYQAILLEALNSVKSGTSVSEAISHYEEIPGIMIQMMRVGEESGQLGNILSTMSP
ncbi:MAG: type II secretion system F family protein, partial [Candidatus Doudnabacteria bacterium]|nr:type II secretion system F family protein [Candidatus Doudnabacteria bacterium]